MHFNSWRNEFISAHDEYRQALLEYTEAMQAYKVDSSHENWERLQKALRRLKRKGEVIELNRMML